MNLLIVAKWIAVARKDIELIFLKKQHSHMKYEKI